MEIDKWINGYKVRAFPWVDGENIYFNVQYYRPGTSVNQPPAFDKSALIADTVDGRRLAYEYTSTCVNYIASLDISCGGMAHIKI